MADITVYTTDPCSFCTRAKALLNQRGLEYDEVNLAKDPSGRAKLVELTGMMSFPQVVIGGGGGGGVLGGLPARPPGPPPRAARPTAGRPPAPPPPGPARGGGAP